MLLDISIVQQNQESTKKNDEKVIICIDFCAGKSHFNTNNLNCIFFLITLNLINNNLKKHIYDFIMTEDPTFILDAKCCD